MGSGQKEPRRGLNGLGIDHYQLRRSESQATTECRLPIRTHQHGGAPIYDSCSGEQSLARLNYGSESLFMIGAPDQPGLARL